MRSEFNLLIAEFFESVGIIPGVYGKVCLKMNGFSILCIMLLVELVVVPIVNGSPVVVRQKRRITGKDMIKGAAVGAAAGVVTAAAAAGIKKAMKHRAEKKAAKAAARGRYH
ncbi:hypothetical protein niasHT_012098 [Heterodera trifolii]|uniref:Uncharacterized protein n=1 Tax=Heterodera trifolii TaxID=157864 RepID=A0ABD2LAF8_9BILA